MRIELAPEALEELDGASEKYELDYTGRGLRFLAAVERTLDRIVEAPLSFPMFLGTRARSVLVPRFPYRVVYELRARNVIRVLAFAHGKRRPGYWRSGRTSGMLRP